MITCNQCKTQNPPEAETCRKCRANLLPPQSASRHTWGIIRAVLTGVFIIALGLVPLVVWGSEANLAYFDSFSILIMLAGMVVLVRGLIRSIRPAPLYTRYLERAARHASTDPEQAMTDFVHGVMLAPARVRQTLTQTLPGDLKNVIALSPYALNPVMSGYQSPEGIRKILYTGYTTWARLAESLPEFGKSVSLGWHARTVNVSSDRKRKEVISSLGRIFNELAEDGLVKKLGYCPKCKTVVSCDSSGHCSCVQKHGAAQGIVYVLPEEVELFNKRLMQVFAS
jgi:hypothetical protein